MPPHGLYTMPRHHLYGNGPSPARPVFNSIDFSASKTEEVADSTMDDKSRKTKVKESSIDDKSNKTKVKDNGIEDKSSEAQAKDRKKKEKKKKKKDKRHSLDAKAEKHAAKSDNPTATPATATPPPYAPPSSHEKKAKDGKRKPIQEDASGTAQKRKRGNTLPNGLSTSNGSFQLNTEFLDDLKSSMGELSKSFDRSLGGSQSIDRPVKKQRKATRKSAGDEATDGIVEAGGSGGRESLGMGTEKKKKRRKEKNKEKGCSSVVATSPAQQGQSSTLLPKKVQTKADDYSQAQRQDKAARFVTETPSSQILSRTGPFDQSPIPFYLPQISITPSASRTKAKKESVVDGLLLAAQDTRSMPSSMPSGAPRAANSSGKNKGFTSSNLLQYKQALSDEPKPRPRGRSSSMGASTASSDSGHSAQNMFTRVNKPYSRSGAEFDPFVTLNRDPEKQKKKKKKREEKRKAEEAHTEGDLATFTTCFTAAQKTVNFTDEHDYRDAYTNFRAAKVAAGPLPCLRKATGCNPQREKALRLSQATEASSPVPQGSPGPDINEAVISIAISRCIEAEKLLMLGVTARIPMPLGRIDGLWKLYCPAYTTTHIDKYAAGQRTLLIAPLAGVQATDTYTARMSLPPRSMAFSIRSFRAPPHASFRSTTLKTVEEGYKFELVFLGNGYLKAYVDLQELLMGKKMEGEGGRGLKMEFWGVRCGALIWEEDVDELEVEGKRMCRAYDGE